MNDFLKWKLVRSLVVARFAAGFAVHEAVIADADVDDRLAQAAILFTLAVALGHIALHATKLGGAGRGRHGLNVARFGGETERDGSN